MAELTPGLKGDAQRDVRESDTAVALGSGLVRVLATPALVALMEAAAVQAVSGQLQPGQTTVGGRIDVRHLAATPVGMRVRAQAELRQIDGGRLTFQVTAWDQVERIGEGTHDRHVVDEARFLERAEGKLPCQPTS